MLHKHIIVVLILKESKSVSVSAHAVADTPINGCFVIIITVNTKSVWNVFIFIEERRL